MINMFKMALEYASSRNDERLFLIGALGLRHDQKLVKSRNLPVMVDQKIMNGYNERYPYPYKHAEECLLRKLGRSDGRNTPIVWVARQLRLNGRMAMARPCKTCETLLSYAGVERVHYTISEMEWGTMFPRSGKDDRIYQF